MYYYKMTSNEKNYALTPETNQIEDINDVQQVVHSNSIASENQSQVIIPWSDTNNVNIQDSNNSLQDTKYEYNNRYYYNQLDNYSKALYETIENNLEQLKSGTCMITVDYDFSDILNNPNSEDALKPYYDDAIDALSLDIPNLFYIDFSKLWLFVETKTSLFTTKYNIYFSTKEDTNLYKDGFYSKDQVNNTINQINTIKSNLINRAYENDYYKIRYVHDWLIENVNYDDSETSRADIYGAIINKKGVCEAYARTFKYILDELGINNILVTGTATNSDGNNENHMWNYVLLNNKWYAVDVTWDDPIVIGGGILSNVAKHRYFLLGSNRFFKNHFESNTISTDGRQFVLPSLEVGDY